MFFRVRASLTERPGALALLATRCGEARRNILGLQIFPDLGQVTDEMVISAPEDWTAGAVAELVSGAGGDEVSVEPCTTHDLIDQPTRWLTAAHDVVMDPSLLPTVLEKLLGPHPEKWSATEHARAAALAALSESADGQPAPSGPTPVEYDETASGIVARIGGHVVGVAAFALTDGRELTIEVAPAFAGRPGVPESWTVTSDSLAVLAAAAIGADEAVLLKPIDGVLASWPSDGPPLQTLTADQLHALQAGGATTLRSHSIRKRKRRR